MKTKITCLMLVLVGLTQPLIAKKSCFNPSRIEEFLKKNQTEVDMFGYKYKIDIISKEQPVVLAKDIKLEPQKPDPDESRHECSYAVKDNPSVIVRVTRLEKLVKTGNRCFADQKIIKALARGKHIIHYKGRNYSIDESHVPENKRITPKQDPILIAFKKGERSENGTEDGRPITVCTYPVTEVGKEEVIGKVIIKRNYKTCFRKTRVLEELSSGSSTLHYYGKDYTINQDALLNEKVEKGKSPNFRLSEGERLETVMDDGKIKVVCTYKALTIAAPEQEVGSINVTRIRQPRTQVAVIDPVAEEFKETQSNIGSN